MRQILEDVAEMLTEQAIAKNLQLNSRTAGDVPALVRGDPLRVRQIMTNLPSNAI